MGPKKKCLGRGGDLLYLFGGGEAEFGDIPLIYSDII